MMEKPQCLAEQIGALGVEAVCTYDLCPKHGRKTETQTEYVESARRAS